MARETSAWVDRPHMSAARPVDPGQEPRQGSRMKSGMDMTLPVDLSAIDFHVVEQQMRTAPRRLAASASAAWSARQ